MIGRLQTATLIYAAWLQQELDSDPGAYQHSRPLENRPVSVETEETRLDVFRQMSIVCVINRRV